MQPHTTKWILILLGTLVAGAAVWALWPSQEPAVPNQGQTALDGTQYPSQYTVSAPQGSSQSSVVLQSPDISAEYAALFSQVGAVGVTMTQVDSSSTGDAAAVYALYSGDVSISKEIYPGESSYPLHVAFLDLNEDGASEAVVYEDFPGFCGTAGCPLDIYQKQGGKWSKIFSTTAQGEVGLLNVYVNGYRSLLLTLSTGGPESGAVTYAWDGKTYMPGAVMATWAGTGFVVSQ